MKRFTIVIMMITITAALWAQAGEETELEVYEAKENLREIGSTSGTGAIQTFDNRYKGVKGTQFAFEEWYDGEIYMKEKKKVKFPNLNYNVFTNTIAYREVESGTTFEINKMLVDFFEIYGPDTMRFVPIRTNPKSEIIFAEQVYKGKAVNLYKVYEKEFLKANYEGGYSADREYDEFVDEVSYYLQFPEKDEMEKVRTSRRMFKQFLDMNSKMKKYLSDYSGKELNNKGVLKKVAGYYDSLH